MPLVSSLGWLRLGQPPWLLPPDHPPGLLLAAWHPLHPPPAPCHPAATPARVLPPLALLLLRLLLPPSLLRRWPSGPVLVLRETAPPVLGVTSAVMTVRRRSLCPGPCLPDPRPHVASVRTPATSTRPPDGRCSSECPAVACPAWSCPTVWCGAVPPAATLPSCTYLPFAAEGLIYGCERRHMCVHVVRSTIHTSLPLCPDSCASVFVSVSPNSLDPGCTGTRLV